MGQAPTCTEPAGDQRANPAPAGTLVGPEPNPHRPTPLPPRQILGFATSDKTQINGFSFPALLEAVRFIYKNNAKEKAVVVVRSRRRGRGACGGRSGCEGCWRQRSPNAGCAARGANLNPCPSAPARRPHPLNRPTCISNFPEHVGVGRPQRWA